MGKELNYIMIGVVLVVVILAIAAGVFLLGSSDNNDDEDSTGSNRATISASGGSEKITLKLTKGGSDIPSGGWPEANWSVYVDNIEVDNLGQGSWDTGKELTLGQNSFGEIFIDDENGFDLNSGFYNIKILINNVIILDKDIEITQPTEYTSENAAVTLSVEDNQTIRVMLVMGGDNYDHNTGYASDDFMILVDGFQVTGITDSWFVAGSWYIDSDNTLASENPIGFELGSNHDVTVAILDTVVYDGTIPIS